MVLYFFNDECMLGISSSAFTIFVYPSRYTCRRLLRLFILMVTYWCRSGPSFQGGNSIVSIGFIRAVCTLQNDNMASQPARAVLSERCCEQRLTSQVLCPCTFVRTLFTSVSFSFSSSQYQAIRHDGFVFEL